MDALFVRRKSHMFKKSCNSYMPVFYPDELDRGILRELQSPASRWNFRESYSRTAKKLHVDEETVRRRITRMESHGVIEGWVILPNPHLLGRECVQVFLETVDDFKKKDAMEQLKKTEGMMSVHSFHNGSLLFSSAYPIEMSPEKQINLIETLCATRSSVVWNEKFPPFELEMTPTDWSILKSVRSGPRRRLSEIAREVGINTRTLNRRMERLVEGHAFYLEILMNYQKIGGLAFTLVVRYEEGKKKSPVDNMILEKLGRSYEWSDTRSNLGYSLFSAFSDNFGETKQTYDWVRSLKGVVDVKMGIQEGRTLFNTWIDEEIELKSGVHGQVRKESMIAVGHHQKSQAPRVLERTQRMKKKVDPWWTGSIVEGRHVRVKIDPDLCMGTASCVAIAPRIFQIDWAKKKGVTQPAPLEVLKRRSADPEVLFLAAQSCPYKVISLEDADTEEQLFP
jgi:DNA-binding Lrp family transcriptional regulator/ferredoxin